MARWCDRCIAELNDRCPVCDSRQYHPDMLGRSPGWTTCDMCGTKLKVCVVSAFDSPGKYMVTGYIESTGIMVEEDDDVI